MTIQEIKDAINAQQDDIANNLYTQYKRNKHHGANRPEIPNYPDKIIFVAFSGSDEVLQFVLKLKINEQGNEAINIEFQGWKGFERYSDSLFCSFPNTDIPQKMIRNIADALSKLRAELLQQEWCPAEYRNQLAPGQENKTSDSENALPERAVEEPETAAADNADENKGSEGNVCAKPWLNPIDNPWLDRKKYPWEEDKIWILRHDFANVQKYNAALNPQTNDKDEKQKKKLEEDRKKFEIHCDAPPQPYIGDPDACIWLLMMNPSYSKADIYDMICCTKDIKEDVLCSIRFRRDKKKGCPYTQQEIKSLLPHFFTPKSDSIQSLTKRQRLMQDQLSFSSTDFYVLNKAFHTVRTREEIKALNNGVKRLDGTLQGSYEWWSVKLLGKAHLAPLCKEDRTRRKSFFNLEFFPYHSRSFDPEIAAEDGLQGKGASCRKMDPRRGLALRIAHHSFWLKMVKYALGNGKILILRGNGKSFNMLSEVRKAAGEDFEKNKGNIFLLNSQNACISVGNLNLVDGFTPAENEGEKAYIARRLAEAMGLTKQEEKDLLPS